jgi:hypothetical protein
MMEQIKPIDTLASASDGTELVETEDGYAVRECYNDPDHDGPAYFETEYEQKKNAVLHFALWLKVDRFSRPDRSFTRFIPTKIATAGKPAMAAWLFLNGGTAAGSRSVVADTLDVSEHTVSRYLSQIRDEVAI